MKIYSLCLTKLLCFCSTRNRTYIIKTMYARFFFTKTKLFFLDKLESKYQRKKIHIQARKLLAIRVVHNQTRNRWILDISPFHYFISCFSIELCVIITILARGRSGFDGHCSLSNCVPRSSPGSIKRWKMIIANYEMALAA